MIVQKAVHCLSHLPTLLKVNYLLYTKLFLIKEYSRKLRTVILQFNQLWEELLRAIFSYMIEQSCRLPEELALEAVQFIRRAEEPIEALVPSGTGRLSLATRACLNVPLSFISL